MHTSEKGLNVIRSFEGRALRAYQDSVGVWTIGYGNTNFDKNAVAKFGKIQRGLTITPEQAEEVFVESIQTGYEPAVNKALPSVSQPAFDAGSGFHYNTGAIGKASWPPALLRGDLGAVKTSLLSWNKAGGSVLAGLTRRRNREYAMIAKGDYGPEGNAGPVELGANGRPTGKQLPSPSAPAAKPGPAPVPAPDKVPGLLRLGMSGAEVEEASGLLVTLGKLKAPKSIFDEELDKAVRAYQGSHPNLTVDGMIGPATFNSLVRDIKLRDATKKTGKATVFVSAAGTAMVAAGYATLNAALIAGAITAAAGLIFVVTTHRTELVTLWNTLRGKQVP